MNFLKLTKVLVIGMALSFSVPAHATILSFVTELSGAQEVPTPTNSTATGTALLSVNTLTQRISLSLVVDGITIEELNDNLVAAPVGPLHLHNGAVGENGPIVVPFPFGNSFQPSINLQGFETGFTVNVVDLLFDDAVALSGSGLNFSGFIAALASNEIYYNLHTDLFAGGELRGQIFADVAAVPVPPAMLLFATGAAGLVRASKKRKLKA